MPHSAYRALLLAVAFILASTSAEAQEIGITAKLHPWGRFDLGSWKTVRVISETLNDQGHVVSACTTDTTTTLLDIDNFGVTLEADTRMEVAGKQFQADPQITRQGFHGEASTLELAAGTPSEGHLVIGGRQVPCKIQRLEANDPRGKISITLYYSTTVAPYLLKREIITRAADGAPPSETVMEVTALEMPVRIREAIYMGAYIRTTHRNAKGTTTTLSVVVPEVPGGVVSHSSKEVDKEGRIVRRNTLELVDYHANSENDRSEPQGRKRSNRRAKPTSR